MADPDVEYVDRDGNPIDPSLVGSSYRIVGDMPTTPVDERGNMIFPDVPVAAQDNSQQEEISYVDKFGNPVDPGLVGSQYRVVGDLPQESGWLDTVRAGLGEVAPTIAKGYAGLTSAAADFADYIAPETFANITPSMRGGADIVRQSAQNIEGAINDQVTTNPGSYKDILKNTIPTVADFAIKLPGGIPAFVAQGATEAFGRKYGDLTEAGAEPGPAAAGAGATAAVTGATNALLANPVFNGTGPVTSALKATGASLLGLPANIATERAVNEQVLGEQPQQSFLQELKNAAPSAIVTGATLGAFGGAMHSRAAKQQRAYDSEVARVEKAMTQPDLPPETLATIPPEAKPIPVETTGVEEGPIALLKKEGPNVITQPAKVEAPVDNLPMAAPVIPDTPELSLFKNLDDTSPLKKDIENVIASDGEKGAIRLGLLIPKLPRWMQGDVSVKERLADIANLRTSEIMESPDFRFWTSKFGKVKQALIADERLAETNPLYKPYYDSYNKIKTETAMAAYDLKKTLDPLADLTDRTRVNTILDALNRKSRTQLSLSPETLRKAYPDITQPEIDAVMGVDKFGQIAVPMMEKAAAAQLNEALARGFINEETYAARQKDLQDHFAGLSDMFYVPMSRFGNYYVIAKSPTGETLEFTLAENKSQVRELKAQLQSKYKDAKVDSGLKPVYADGDLNNLPLDIASSLSILANDGAMPAGKAPPVGFGRHLLKAKGTAGYDTDFFRPLNDYAVSLARWQAKVGALENLRLADEAVNNAIKTDYEATIRGEKQGDGTTQALMELKKRAELYKKNILDPRSAHSAFSSAMFHYFLGFNPKSSILNTTQQITTTLPKLMAELGEIQGPKYWASAHKNLAKYALNKANFAKSDFGKQLMPAIERANREGVLGDDSFTEMIKNSTKKQKTIPGTDKSFSDLSAYLFGKTEQWNRYHAFTASLEAGLRRKGLSYEDAYQYAKKITEDTQFKYGVGDRIELARKYPTAFIFKSWNVNYFHHILNSIRNRGGKNAIRVALPYIASMASVGGLSAVPFINMVTRFMESKGDDPKRMIREVAAESPVFKEALADTTIYGGLATATGASVGSALGVGTMLPELQDDPGTTVANIIGGPPVGILTNAYTATRYAKQGDYGRAVEALAPNMLKGPMKAARYASEGVLGPNGDVIVPKEKVDAKMLGLTATNFPDMRIAKAYEKRHTAQVEGAAAKKDSSWANNLVYRAIYDNRGDAKAREAAVKAAIQEIQAQNQGEKFKIKINVPSIRKRLKEANVPNLDILNQLPKDRRQDYQQYLSLFSE